MSDVDWEALEEAARAASRQAHAPYSEYRVGAALLDDAGRIHSGANVENASYGLTQCAERSAIGAAITAGARRFVAMTLVGGEIRPATPCGACRQVLAEFPPSFPIRCLSHGGDRVDTSVAGLLPMAFGRDDIPR